MAMHSYGWAQAAFVISSMCAMPHFLPRLAPLYKLSSLFGVSSISVRCRIPFYQSSSPLPPSFFSASNAAPQALRRVCDICAHKLTRCRFQKLVSTTGGGIKRPSVCAGGAGGGGSPPLIVARACEIAALVDSRCAHVMPRCHSEGGPCWVAGSLRPDTQRGRAGECAGFSRAHDFARPPARGKSYAHPPSLCDFSLSRVPDGGSCWRCCGPC